jgi:CheY-like chemotaxis protein
MSTVRRVLVIEDDDDIREVMKEALASEGYVVDGARDGLDALSKLESQLPPALILLDMMMPRMDGEAFLKALRGRSTLATTPVVVISGSAAAREQASQLAAAAFLVKPFELDELLGLIRRLADAESATRISR